MGIRHRIHRAMPPHIWAKYFLFRKGKASNLKEIEFDKELSTYKVSDGERSLYLAKRERIYRYQDGLSLAVERVGLSYSLNHIQFMPGDVVIDCGANIGEVGLYLKDVLAKEVSYHAFEPSVEEYECCLLNHPNCSINNLGLWETEGTLIFYNKNETGDSSLFEIENYTSKTTVDVTTVDDYIKSRGVSKVKLLKLEAEGAEPEILSGCTKSLARIEYIAADVGPERGLSEETTISDIVTLLYSNGFEIVAGKRFRILFQNKHFNPALWG